MNRSPATALTRNQYLVLGALERAEGPLSAYGLLSRLGGEGIKAPVQIYRALESLVDAGRAHRLESLNAWVACRRRHRPGRLAVFAICEECGDVDEFQDAGIEGLLAAGIRRRGFTVTDATIELHGRCRDCGGEAGS